MSLLSTKGVLAGAVVATAGALSFGIAPALAAPGCPVATVSFGSFTTPCLLPGGEGITLTISGATDSTAGISVASNGAFGAFGNGLTSGSFNFQVDAAPGSFFNFADFIALSPGTVTTSLFTFNTTGQNFNNSDLSLTSISGSYSYTGGALVANSVLFTTDVPVPLPIVGAGLAFGFTRNLRKRAKSLG